MIEYIEKAIDLTKKYSQLKSKNHLIMDIMNVCECDEDTAEETAEAICKVVTFWIEAFSKELFDYEFIEYYQKCLDSDYVIKDKRGYYTYLALTLAQLAEKYDFEIKEINSFQEFCNYKKNEEFLGIVRIKTKSGMHSIICYRDASGKLKLSDTWDRGYDVDFFKFVNEDNFKYFTELSI